MKKRNGAIDFWKFVFSLVIIMFHSVNFLRSSKQPLFVDGANAVEFFFLVSGYLMVASLMKYDTNELSVGKSTWKFIGHKIKGMCPEYYVAWAIGFCVMHMGKVLKIRTIVKHALTSVWELSFLRMDGMIAFSSNGATWYISAMLLSMLILVPLFLKNKDLFLYVIAPLITLAVFGYLYQTTGTLRGIKEWMGICLKGPLRAIGVMCLGCVCYVVCQKMREWSYTRLAQALLSIVEIGGYVFAIYWMYGHEASEMEFVIAVIFAVSVTISFSRKGLLSPLFDNKVVYWLGTFSFPLFLSHHFWSMRMRKLFPKQTYRELLPKYFLLAIVTAFAIYFISKGIRKWYAKYGDRVKAIFVLRCRL